MIISKDELKRRVMISVLENLDTVNFMIQNCVSNSMYKPLRGMNSFVSFDGYAMDVITSKSNRIELNIRTSTLQTLCRIVFTPTQMLVRYGPKFMFLYNKKTSLFTTNLFDDAFELSEMEGHFFAQNLVVDWGLQVQFNFDIMSETLTQCWRLYDAFLATIKK